MTTIGEGTTTRAIFDSYRFDVDLLRSQQKGKQRAGELTDFEFALNLFLADLDETEQLVTDRIMAESLAHAVYTDEAVIAELIDEETQATRDHNFAQQVERRERTGETVVNTSPPSSSSLGPSNGAVNASGSTANDDLDDLDALLTKTDASTPEKLQQAIAERKYTTRVCNTCFERTHFSSSLTTKCGHNFCRSCVCKLFVHATTDESLYPPRCCRHPVPVEKVLGWMKPVDAAKFRKAALEYEAEERTYCFDPKCGAFIISTGRDGAVSCLSCKKLTCGRCKAADHGMLDCPNDGSLKKVLQLAETSGWKRCPRCRAVVERVSGCDHITCKCGSHWCYICSMPWTGNDHTCPPATSAAVGDRPRHQHPVQPQQLPHQPAIYRETLDDPEFDLEVFDDPEFDLEAFDGPEFDLEVFDDPEFDLEAFDGPEFDLEAFDGPEFDLEVFDDPEFDLEAFDGPVFDW